MSSGSRTAAVVESKTSVASLVYIPPLGSSIRSKWGPSGEPSPCSIVATHLGRMMHCGGSLDTLLRTVPSALPAVDAA